MIRYDIVQDYNVRSFIQKVAEKLNDGWELVGGLVCSGIYYNQAIIKKERSDG